MNSTERRLKIYDILVDKETVDVGELSATFNVSAMTIRRDLAIFENQGLITTTYGGAYMNNKISDTNGTTPTLAIDDDVRLIGKAACRRLSHGERIFLEAGAISSGLIYGLKFLRLTVMTNSLLAANVLRSFSNIKLIMMPGDYDKETSGFLSSSTISFMRNYNFEAAILNGIFMDTSAGLTADTEIEAHLKATAVTCASRSMILLKSESIGKIGFAQAVNPQKLECIVTDNGITPEQAAAFEKRGISVVVGE